MLEGEPIRKGDPVIEQWNEFSLARMFGWTLDEIEAAPAHWIDWAIAMKGLGNA